MLNNRLNFKQLKQQLPLKQHCILCTDFNGGDLGLCAACLHELPWVDDAHCPQCALPSDGLICGQCLSASPNFDVTEALFRYDFPVDALLQHFKYHHSLHLGNTFAHLLLRHSINKPTENSTTHPDIDVIIPMPMHPERLRLRGFNQALELARIFADHLNIPLDYVSCIRTKRTPPQASLPLKERIQNMQGVFDCNKSMQGLGIALVDDVMTSGASLNALAKTLKKAGAAHIECWVIARTMQH